MKKLRPFGEILLDMEPLIQELMEHDIQHGDLISLIHVYLTVHYPNAIEVYEDGSSPVLKYGPNNE